MTLKDKFIEPLACSVNCLPGACDEDTGKCSACKNGSWSVDCLKGEWSLK